MYFQVSSSKTFIQPNERTEIIPSQTLRKKDRYKQIFNGEELRWNGVYPDSRNQSVLFYFIHLFCIFGSRCFKIWPFWRNGSNDQLWAKRRMEEVIPSREFKTGHRSSIERLVTFKNRVSTMQTKIHAWEKSARCCKRYNLTALFISLLTASISVLTTVTGLSFGYFK